MDMNSDMDKNMDMDIYMYMYMAMDINTCMDMDPVHGHEHQPGGPIVGSPIVFFLSPILLPSPIAIKYQKSNVAM